MQSYIKKINNTTKILKIFKNIFILLNCYEIIAWRGMEGWMGWQFDSIFIPFILTLYIWSGRRYVWTDAGES